MANPDIDCNGAVYGLLILKGIYIHMHSLMWRHLSLRSTCCLHEFKFIIGTDQFVQNHPERGKASAAAISSSDKSVPLISSVNSGQKTKAVMLCGFKFGPIAETWRSGIGCDQCCLKSQAERPPNVTHCWSNLKHCVDSP